MNNEQKDLIDNSVEIANILREQKELIIIDFFSRRPGGNYVINLIMLLFENKIECTEDVLSYYIPSNVCSKSTLANIITDGVKESYLVKADCKKDHRSKNITPTIKTVEQWNLWRKLMNKK